MPEIVSPDNETDLQLAPDVTIDVPVGNDVMDRACEQIALQTVERKHRHAKIKQIRSDRNWLPLWIRITAIVFGLSAGILAGLSESPVAGVVLTGVFGVVGGVAANQFFNPVARSEERGRHRLFMDLHSNVELQIVFFQAMTLACVFLVVGAFLGAGFRTGNIWPKTSKSDSPKLRSISTYYSDLGASEILRLQILQQKLDGIGVSIDENNATIEQIAAIYAPTKVDSVGQFQSKGKLQSESVTSEAVVPKPETDISSLRSG